MPPLFVNFSALLKRLFKICPSRDGSPITMRSSATLLLNESTMFFSSALNWKDCTVVSTFSSSLKGICSNSNLPDDIFSMSSISLTIARSVLAEEFIKLVYFTCCSLSVVLDSRLVMPSKPVSGVRISWLIFARKNSFALAESSMLRLVLRSSFSIFIRSVISCENPIIYGSVFSSSTLKFWYKRNDFLSVLPLTLKIPFALPFCITVFRYAE